MSEPEVPEPGQAVNVTTDRYECYQCGAVVEVADFDHRTRVGYGAPTIRCQCKNVPMYRVSDRNGSKAGGDDR